MIIRPVRLSDAPQLAEVVSESWMWAYREIIPEHRLELDRQRFIKRRFEERIRENQHLLLVAIDGSGRLVGMVSETWPARLPNFHREISELYVLPYATRNGIGKALVESAIKEFTHLGHRSLCIQALRDNPIGCGFYEKLGGQIVEQGEFDGLATVIYGWLDMSQILTSNTIEE